jgi:hypothetical protein
LDCRLLCLFIAFLHITEGADISVLYPGCFYGTVIYTVNQGLFLFEYNVWLNYLRALVSPPVDSTVSPIWHNHDEMPAMGESLQYGSLIGRPLSTIAAPKEQRVRRISQDDSMQQIFRLDETGC